MPELPEAEFARRAVEAECLNRTIEDAGPGRNVTHLDLPGKKECARLIGRQFTEARRHGKMIFAGSRSGPWIGVHLGMTGRLVPYAQFDAAPKDAKFVIRFEGERRLGFLNRRKLGWLKVIDDPSAFIEQEGYGPDALAISRADFVRVIGGTKGAVKPALMDQRKLAGIGNLWSDEILFQTSIGPTRKASDLPETSLGEMFDAMRAVLERVMEDPADRSKLPADWLIHSRSKGAQCPRCRGTITSRKVGGRTAYYCPKHQD